MLGRTLFQEISADFFRLLTGPNAGLHIDAVEALAREMGEVSSGISRAEAVETVLQVVERHAGMKAEDTESTEDLTSPRAQANFVLNRLIATGWMSEPPRSDYQRIVFFERQGEIQLDALRRIALPDAATFTDKLQLVCVTLANPETFTDQPWHDLEGCLSNARLGLQELRGIQKSVERMTRRQLETTTLRENLALLYDEFSEAIGHSCYRELVRVRLPIRVKQARRRLEEIEHDERTLDTMQREVLRRRITEDPTAAISHVRLRIHELFQLLEAVEPQAERVDQRAADFARRSFARFRYLQEVGSVRREQVQQVFELLNKRFAGSRISEIEPDPALPALQLPEAGLLGGIECLYLPRRRREAGEIDPIADNVDSDDVEDALLEMEANLRDSLTAIRANRFVETLDFQGGDRISSGDLSLRTEDDIADLASVLLHAESLDARYRIRSQRDPDDGDEIQSDRKAGYLVERFDLEKKKSPSRAR